MKKLSLTGNQLKLIALVTMTIDHVGMELFPRQLILGIIGRLAMPIFAYMIAEGCRHTRNKAKYLLTMLAFAAVCQAVYFFAMGSLYMCILVTFSLSICLIFLLERSMTEKSAAAYALFGCAAAAVYVLCEVLPGLLPGIDFRVDYGFWGVMLPVFIYLGKTRSEALVMSALGMTLLSAACGYIQWYSLAALPLLALYSGQRGKYKMKYLFYIYYPAHLAVLHCLSLLR